MNTQIMHYAPWNDRPVSELLFGTNLVAAEIFILKVCSHFMTIHSLFDVFIFHEYLSICKVDLQGTNG